MLSQKPFNLFPPQSQKRSRSAQAEEVHGTEATSFQKKSYQPLSSTTALTPKAQFSCRGKNRENLLLDLESKELKSYFEAFVREYKIADLGQMLAKTQPLEEEETPSKDQGKNSSAELVYPSPWEGQLLQQLIQFSQKALPRMAGDPLQLEKELAALIEKEQKSLQLEKSSIALLEWFPKAKKAVCRQQALFTAYLLVELIQYLAEKNGGDYESTQSRVYRYRSSLLPKDKQGQECPHAVVIYEADNGHRYLLDSMKGLVLDLTDLSFANLERLNKAYHPYQGDLWVKEINEVYAALRPKSDFQCT